jgi:hypothetical protein
MNKLSIVGLIIVVIGFIGMMSTGCLSNEPNSLTIMRDNVEEISNKQDAVLKEMGIYQNQVNNKLDAILLDQRAQTDLTHSLISEIRKQSQTNTIPTRIDILVKRDGYNEISSFNNVDEARTYINGLK